MTIEELIQKTKVFLLDMDGTIYIDETPIGEMKKTLSLLRERGKKLVYCTNNSSKTPEEYREKLAKIGFWDSRDFVYTSGTATAEYLKKYHAGKRVYLLGREALKADFTARGIPLNEENPEVCVLAYDTEVTFEKLKKFNEFLVNGCFYAATHPDAVCPAKGVFPPDVGSFIKLFECSSHRLPDVVCGKPYKMMGEALEGLLDAKNDEIAMVGDRLHTDIRFANNSGFTGVLVLSGETTKEMLQGSKDRPDIVLNSLNDVAAYL